MNANLRQRDMILMFMQENDSITQVDAMKEFGCFRLAARINDLKKDGYKIGSRTCKAKNRYGDTVRFAEYYLEDKSE